MQERLLSSELWESALEKYAETTGLTVRLFGLDAAVALATVHPTPLVELFQEHGFEPGLFAKCARRCLSQTDVRPAVVSAQSHGLTVVGTSLVLEGVVVGAAVAGYALAGFSEVAAVQRWAGSAGVPFDRLWNVVRRQPPVPERRLLLHGELLQVLGDGLLRENHRTRQYQDAVAKLEAASSAKDEFLAVLSHELRTPLAAIVGWASILQKTQSAEQVRQAAEAIGRNAQLQAQMVDDLLDMNLVARGGVKLDLKVHKLTEVIRGALEVSVPGIEKKALRLEVVEAGGPLLVEGDAGRLQQIFRNILLNAVKFTPQGGTILVTLKREADNARIAIADSGAGIAPEFLPFVFEIFRQQEQGSRREHEGLGLGLALVKQLTELHHGTVTISSAGPGLGTEVVVRLPLAPAAAQVDDIATPSAGALSGLSVLVVEDAADMREFLRVLLGHLGAQVALACDGREALDMIQDAHPNVVLCDLRMPRMDGFEFIRELRRTPSYPPVVAMSALAGKADRQHTREAGFEGHITKPFDDAALVAALDAALAR